MSVLGWGKVNVVVSANAFLQFSKADVVSSVGLISTFFLVQPLSISVLCLHFGCLRKRDSVVVDHA
jgi:hypothetical protein